MSKKENPFLNVDWADSQRKYWNAWTDMCQQSLSMAQEAVQPEPTRSTTPDWNFEWAKGLEYWRQAVSASIPEESQAPFDRLMRQGRGYMQMNEGLMNFLQGLSTASKSSSDWQQQLQAQFDGMKTLFTQDPSSFSQGLGALDAFSNLPLDNWQKFFSAQSPFPGDFTRSMKAHAWTGGQDDLNEHVNRFLSVPGVGYSREFQDQYSRLATLILDYQQINQEYHQALGKVASEALDKLQQKIMSMAEEGSEINSLRELYDLWVDCSEAAYSDFVRSPDYSELYARMVNALMAVKQQMRTLTEELMSAVGVPTQTDFDTLARRQQELRRSMHELRSPARQPENSAVQQELAALRQELAALKQEVTQLSTTTAPAPARKKSVSRKKASSRKKTVSKKKVSSTGTGE